MKTWVMVPDALERITNARLQKLTNDRDEWIPVGTGDGVTVAFDLPYAFIGAALDLTVKVAGTPTAIAVTSGGGTDSHDLATFSAAPASGAAITANSKTGINVVVLDKAVLRAAATVRGRVYAGGYQVPATTAHPVADQLGHWAWDLALFFLVTDFRRAPLIESYPDVKLRYEAAVRELDLVAKGPAYFSLEGILALRDPEIEPEGESVGPEFVSDGTVFSGARGVM